jgi:hypothetical protein
MGNVGFVEKEEKKKKKKRKKAGRDSLKNGVAATEL